MTTSNTYTFNLSSDQIVQHALILDGVYTQDDVTNNTFEAADMTFGTNALNLMLKSWEMDGIHLWTNIEGTIFLTQSQQYYNLTSSGDIAGDDAVFTNTSVIVNGGESLTVLSTLGMNVNDNIGIVLDNNTIQWTTIATIPSFTTLTLNANITSQASSGNNVFVFTNRINLPLAINSARYKDSSGYERDLAIVGRKEFMIMPNKTEQGPCNQAYFSNRISDARFYVWPTAEDVGDCIRISYSRKIQDCIEGSGDYADIPVEDLKCVIYNLAMDIASGYGIDTDKLNPAIAKIAASTKEELGLWDSDPESLRVNQGYNWYE